MRFERKNGDLIVRMDENDAIALARILTRSGRQIAPPVDELDREEWSRWCELAGAVEAFTGSAVLATADVLEVLDGDRDAVESEGDHAKAWRSAWDVGAGEIS